MSLSYVKRIVKEAKKNSFLLSSLNSAVKEKLLLQMAQELMKNKEVILKANKKDIELAEEKKVKKSLISIR